MSKKERIKRSAIIILIMVIACISIISSRERRLRKKQEEINVKVSSNYNIDIIKEFHNVSNKKNYLLSPYNIEIALNMLREGADGKTREELDKVLGNRTINDVSIKDKVDVANAIFVKDIYKNDVKTDFYNTLNNKYHSDVIYDEFYTPDKINNWVKEKTNGMIEKILDEMNKDYVMGLASALAIDVTWQDSFECNSTTGEEFTKANNQKEIVEMMHKKYDTNIYKYLKTDEVEGVIIPYKKEDNSNVELEFVGLLPTSNVDSFINNLTKEKLDNIISSAKEAGDNFNINVSLPRFKYDYEAPNFIDILKNIGIKEAFDPDNANFKKMIEIPENVYVGEAIHKTHIELNEKGTKAAAVTYFGMFKNSAMINEPETVNVNFNKPFIYMIRENNTGEILFFGVVFEPNTWNGTTCSNK